MSTIVKLVQGSPEWHAHRAKYRNASETPVVLGLSPWTTPHQLWQIKTGRAPQPDVTAAMAHGTATEPLAREAYEKLTGYVMQPLVLVEGDYSASPRRHHARSRSRSGDQMPEEQGLEDPERSEGRANPDRHLLAAAAPAAGQPGRSRAPVRVRRRRWHPAGAEAGAAGAGTRSGKTGIASWISSAPIGRRRSPSGTRSSGPTKSGRQRHERISR